MVTTLKRLACTALVLAAFSVHAQEESGDSGQLTILYRLRFDENFYYLAEKAVPIIWKNYEEPFPDAETWQLSLEAFMANTSRAALLFRTDEEGDMAALALERNIPVYADIFVSGTIAVEAAAPGNRNGETLPPIKVEYSFGDLIEGSWVFSGTINEVLPREQDLFAYFWLPLAKDLERFVDLGVRHFLAVYGPPGTRIGGFSPQKERIDETGILRIPVSMPGTYAWTMEHRRYKARRGIFLAELSPAEFRLPAERFYPLSVNAGLFMGRFPELWINYSFGSRGFFLGLGVQQQFFGIGLSGDAGKTRFAPRHILSPGIEAGYRFFPFGRFQIYAGAAVLCGINFDSSSLDRDAPLSVLAGAGIEWESPLKLSLYAEMGAGMVIPGTGRERFEDPGIFTWNAGGVFLEFPVFRLGIKAPIPF